MYPWKPRTKHSDLRTQAAVNDVAGYRLAIMPAPAARLFLVLAKKQLKLPAYISCMKCSQRSQLSFGTMFV